MKPRGTRNHTRHIRILLDDLTNTTLNPYLLLWAVVDEERVEVKRIRQYVVSDVVAPN
jgi:hypothetical protein